MNALLVSIAVVALGIDVGWKRLPDGGSEYIIQLNRQTLDALGDGQPIASDIMPDAGEVRSFRIIVGDGEVARESPPKKPAPQTLAIEPPKPLMPDPVVKPIAERRTNYTQTDGKAAGKKEEGTTKTKKAAAPDRETSPSDRPPRPWLPLTLTLFGLFTSLGANAYLGWIACGLRRQCISDRANNVAKKID